MIISIEYKIKVIKSVEDRNNHYVMCNKFSLTTSTVSNVSEKKSGRFLLQLKKMYSLKKLPWAKRKTWMKLCWNSLLFSEIEIIQWPEPYFKLKRMSLPKDWEKTILFSLMKLVQKRNKISWGKNCFEEANVYESNVGKLQLSVDRCKHDKGEKYIFMLMKWDLFTQWLLIRL